MSTLIRCAWLVCLCCAPAAAQESAAPAPARIEFAVEENDATRAAAADALEAVNLAKDLAKEDKAGEAREALRATLAELLAVSGREKSAAISAALEDLGKAATAVNDTECAVLALEPVLAFRAATLGTDDDRVHALRAQIGHACWELGRLDTAKELLGTVLEHARRTLEPEDRRLCGAMSDYAVTLYYLDDCENACHLMGEVVEILKRTHDPDDPEIQWAFGNLGNMLDKLGDIDGALANRERVHRNYSKARPEGHPDVLIARHNLALSLTRAGDPIAARALLQDVLTWYEKRYPPGHLKLERALQNLSITLHDLGDFESARIILEGIIQRRGGKGWDKDPTLQSAQTNLVRVLASLGREEEAADLSRKLLEQNSAAFGADSLWALDAATALAVQLSALGKYDEAIELKQRVLHTLEEKHPDNESELTSAQARLGYELFARGDVAAGANLLERAFDASRRRLGADHELTLRMQSLLAAAIRKSEPDRSRRLLRELGERLLGGLASTTAALSPREAELKAYSLAPLVDVVLAGVRNSGDDALAFELIETARLASWAGTRSAALLERTCASDESVRKLRDELRSKAALVARFAQQGRREDYEHAALDRGKLEQQLAAAVRGFAAASLGSVKPSQIAAVLPEGAAAVSLRRYQSLGENPRSKAVAWYVAFVLRKDGALARVELGQASAIDRALERWRKAIGIDAPPLDAEAQRAAGLELRALLVDPLREATVGARTWIVAPDDALHLVPLDALPLETGVVGDQLRIEVRTHLGELAADRAPASERRDLVALGGVDFDALSAEPPESTASAEKPGDKPRVDPLRASERMPPPAAHFSPLLASSAEIADVAGVFRARFRDGPKAWVLEGPQATKSALVEAAAKARWLHIATHGYFAPGSYASFDDDDSVSADFAREVRGLSPRVLCGLALAGANAPENVAERSSGVLTAEELAWLDLDGCELAVLSACDTNAGVRRAGQGVASLQNAVHSAGARSAITAMWTVSDESTRALMLSFYRGLWQEHLSKGDALWRAKNELRAKRAPTREWAAWLLSGDPR